jgi:hypothetical protein
MDLTDHLFLGSWFEFQTWVWLLLLHSICALQQAPSIPHTPSVPWYTLVIKMGASSTYLATSLTCLLGLASSALGLILSI